MVIWNIVKNKGYCINPVKNLVTNIGFDGSGYHMLRKKSFLLVEIILSQIKMHKPYYSQSINISFQKNFKMKLFSFLCFKYLHIKLIDFLFKLKFKNNKRNAEKNI